MKSLLVPFFLLITLWANGQERWWTETDRQYQVQNLKRTQEAIEKATVSLTEEQWHFRGSPQSWSIAEIVEHLALWEIIFAREINLAMRNGPNPSLKQACRTDSSYLDFILEEKAHNAPDYARPTGFIHGKNNFAFFQMRRQQSIAFVDSTKADLRLYHEAVGGGVFRNVHQVLLVQWGHVDRHLRQIQRVKEHARFPRNTSVASD